MEKREEALFVDYVQRCILTAENHQNTIQFLLNHPLVREEFAYWLSIGKKVPWRPESTTRLLSESRELCSNSKDIEKSILLRKEGSLNFAKAGVTHDGNEHLRKALECYNEALLHSSVTPDASSRELENAAILFANRSAVFFEMKRYQSALKDIELALRLGYPSDLKWKVWIRKANIFVALRKFGKVLELVKLIENSLGSEEKTLNKISSRLHILRETAENGLHMTGSELDFEPCESWKVKRYNRTAYEENPEFEYGSSAIQIQYTERAQRSVITVNDIKLGDVLFNEVPYASVLLPEYSTTHCHHCHAHIMFSMYPCGSCSQVRYCSEECSLLSWSEYHQFECKNLSLLESVGLGHLATRIALIARPGQILEALTLEPTLNDPQKTLTLYRKGSSKYQRVFALMHHAEELHPMDYFKYAEVAAFVTAWLKEKTKFFDGVSSDDIFKVGGVILRHFCQLICNAQRVYSFPTTLDGEYLTHEERTSVGSAIFTSTSLMNHTCDPKISTNYKFVSGEGRQFIVKAIRDIPAGSELGNSYGFTFRRQDLCTRQQGLLQQYFFKCACEQCLKETNNNCSFVEQFSSIRCKNKACRGPIYTAPLLRSGTYEGRCTHCNSEQEFKSAEDALRLSVELNEAGLDAIVCEDWQAAMKHLRSSYDLRRKFVHPNHSLLSESFDSFARLYNTMGQNEMALPYLKKSVDHVSIRYGEHSNEYAQELQKYVQLLTVLGIEVTEDGLQRDYLTETVNRLMEAYSPSTDTP